MRGPGSRSSSAFQLATVPGATVSGTSFLGFLASAMLVTVPLRPWPFPECHDQPLKHSLPFVGATDSSTRPLSLHAMRQPSCVCPLPSPGLTECQEGRPPPSCHTLLPLSFHPKCTHPAHPHGSEASRSFPTPCPHPAPHLPFHHPRSLGELWPAFSPSSPTLPLCLFSGTLTSQTSLPETLFCPF